MMKLTNYKIRQDRKPATDHGLAKGIPHTRELPGSQIRLQLTFTFNPKMHYSLPHFVKACPNSDPPKPFTLTYTQLYTTS